MTIIISITSCVTKPSGSFKYSSKSIRSLDPSSYRPSLVLKIAYLTGYTSSRNAVAANISTLGLPNIPISISIRDWISLYNLASINLLTPAIYFAIDTNSYSASKENSSSAIKSSSNTISLENSSIL